MPDLTDDYAQNHPYRTLGLRFWLPWSAAMLALVGAFPALVFFYWDMPQPGRVIITGTGGILFTLALVGLNMLRYQSRFLVPMVLYMVLMLAATYYWKNAHPTGLAAVLTALAPTVPILFALRAMHLWSREETTNICAGACWKAGPSPPSSPWRSARCWASSTSSR